MTYQQWLSKSARLLIESRLTESDSPKRDVEILLSFVTGKSRTFLIAFAETELTDAEFATIELLLQRRVNGEPIAYLTGQREFWSLPLKVSPATLIPRPDTEKLVELALEHLPVVPATVLDLGTGTGAIALAIASERPDCQITGIDYQIDAVELAKSNAQQLNISNVSFQQSNWFSTLLAQRFDLIVSNPPYIDGHDPHLNEGDVRFEPKTALVSGQQGLADIKHIVGHSHAYLQSNGWLMIEHGWTQGQQVRDIFTYYGFKSIITEKDYGGNERVTIGCL